MSGKRFRFSLDSVLKLRAHEAEVARQDLAEIRQHVQRQEQLLKESEDALETAVHARRTGATGQGSLRRMEAYRQAAHERVIAERHKLRQLHERENEARLLLLKRKGAEETMRRLEEEERDSYWKKIRSAESEQLDEQAISGYQRQRRTAS